MTQPQPAQPKPTLFLSLLQIPPSRCSIPFPFPAAAAAAPAPVFPSPFPRPVRRCRVQIRDAPPLARLLVNGGVPKSGIRGGRGQARRRRYAAKGNRQVVVQGDCAAQGRGRCRRTRPSPPPARTGRGGRRRDGPPLSLAHLFLREKEDERRTSDELSPEVTSSDGQDASQPPGGA